MMGKKYPVGTKLVVLYDGAGGDDRVRQGMVAVITPRITQDEMFNCLLDGKHQMNGYYWTRIGEYFSVRNKPTIIVRR